MQRCGGAELVRDKTCFLINRLVGRDPDEIGRLRLDSFFVKLIGQIVDCCVRFVGRSRGDLFASGTRSLRARSVARLRGCPGQDLFFDRSIA